MHTSALDTVPLEEALEELSSAEDFLTYFGVAFDPAVVHVNRLHIMQRFHDYLHAGESMMEEADNDDIKRAIYIRLLQRAYADFVTSDALTEKVFKVFKLQGPQTTFVPMDQLLGG